MADKISWLLTTELSELLKYADRKQIGLISRVGRPLVQSQIAKFFKIDPFTVKFGKFEEFYVRKIGLMLNARFFEREESSLDHFHKFLVEEGIPFQYLRVEYYPEAVATIIWEKEYAIPEDFFKKSGLWPLDVVTMSKENYNFIAPYDISQKEFIILSRLMNHEFLNNYYSKLKILQNALAYQETDKIYPFAKKYGYKGKEKSKKDIIEFLLDQMISVEEYLPFLQELNDYPGRREIIEAWVEHFITDQFIVTFSPEVILAFPPLYNDEAIHKVFENYFSLKYATTSAPIQRERMIRKIEEGDPDLIHYTSKDILISLGLDGNSSYQDSFPNFRTVRGLKNNLTIPQFDLNRDLVSCKRKLDIFLEPLTDFVITYGTLRNFVCYSPEDLENAFEMDEETGFISFRRPEKPSETFPEQNIKELFQLLQTQNPRSYNNFTIKAAPFLKKLSKILGIALVGDNLELLTDEDQEHVTKLLMSLFYAGMYQRTWKGPGNPYPLKTHETTGSCQEDIEGQMPPELNNVMDEFEKLTQDGKKIVNKLPLIYKASEGSIYSDNIIRFVNTTRRGDYCVGGGSQLMIETPYYYLRKMGIIIPDFDYPEFEAESTHR